MGQCPNAPAVVPRAVCELCGEKFFDDELVEGVCGDCAVGGFSWEMGERYIKEDPVAFFEWYYQITYRGNNNHAELTELFWREFFWRVDGDWDEKVRLLRDYCLEEGAERRTWVKFLKAASC